MNPRKLLNKTRARRAKRSRAKILGSTEKPRLAIFRSNKNIYAQLIDDGKSHTLAQASSAELEKSSKLHKTGAAAAVGELLAKKASKLGIKTAAFDRRGYKYHGRISALADGARKGGLKI
ncbi:MAG: 50S ribosomal protein L18 [Patescibacteria group bacterium]|nr:50S ribosomal protein L18 [Patescibacteria group bacterium]MDE2015570.1 50S ribosomal protein L18 [Patescibacteria group bacterium]MDE2227234.1 50S ribosomal protein L18 [Patescibacteria group bacterium]